MVKYLLRAWYGLLCCSRMLWIEQQRTVSFISLVFRMENSAQSAFALWFPIVKRCTCHKLFSIKYLRQHLHILLFNSKICLDSGKVSYSILREWQRMREEQWNEKWLYFVERRYAFHFISFSYAIVADVKILWAVSTSVANANACCKLYTIREMMDWIEDWNYYAPSWNVASINHRHRTHAYCILHWHCDKNRMWKMAARYYYGDAWHACSMHSQLAIISRWNANDSYECKANGNMMGNDGKLPH